MGEYNIQEIKSLAASFDKIEVYRKKIMEFQKQLRKKEIAGVVCMKPQNTFYLSGFNPVLYSHPVIVIVPAEGEAVLLVHCLRAEHARLEACVRLFAGNGTSTVSELVMKEISSPSSNTAT